MTNDTGDIGDDDDDDDDDDHEVVDVVNDRGSMRAGWCCECLRAVDVQLCCVVVKALNLVLNSVSL